ncbi:NUDIX hydrolase [uncultured Cohaesibacter sp.]|uniref:NUDIX hydrolase n=1 Tax=uncultured Cohaesibacter sp. TaxID=1002546 RepID=UPI002930F4B9|nr:NUDIX hydrolase [uncultured Cohaesibacter sp.]
MKSPRHYPDHPILGVSALVRFEDQILLVKRGNPPLKGRWSLPGGVVEVGESLKEAVKREVMEETGLSFIPHDLADLVEIIQHDSDQRCERHFVLAVFLGTVGDDSTASGPESARLATNRIPHAGDDAADACWITIDQLGSVELTDGTLDVITHILAGASINPVS